MKGKGVLTTISFSWALLILLSSANFQPFASFTKAVSGISAILSSVNHPKREKETEEKDRQKKEEGTKEERRKLTVPRAQCPNMITNPIQIISKRSNLSPRIIHILSTPLSPIRDISTQIQPLHREDDMIFRFIPKHPILGRKPLQLDDDDGR